MNTIFKKKIDELGRVVIPKQIRKDLKINNYDELDIYINDDSIILKKNIGLLPNKEKIENFIYYISKLIKYDILIFEKNNLLISTLLDNSNFIYNKFEYNIVLQTNNKYIYKSSIIIDSNYIGDIIFVNTEKFNKDNENIIKIKSILIELIK